ncbi:MAG: PD-(D/E)XK nuclease family protein [Legionellales bacterium]|nr:PD-(D/E)XK nuclease family protein [Legionellales bacterium]
MIQHAQLKLTIRENSRSSYIQHKQGKCLEFAEEHGYITLSSTYTHVHFADDAIDLFHFQKIRLRIPDPFGLKYLMQTIDSRIALLNAMKQGAYVITPNNRLCHQLLQDHFQQTSASATVADKPRCLPYLAFLRDLYHNVRELHVTLTHPILLTPPLQRDLWRQILGHQSNDGLLSEVQEAWARCQHWLIDPLHLAFADTKQTELFQQWAHLFKKKLQELNAITAEQIVDYLLRFPSIFASLHVVWVCFDDYSPQLQALQKTIERQYSYDLSPQKTLAHQFSAKDNADEHETMMQWVKDKLQAGETRIAVVVPDLEKKALSLTRLLKRHFQKDQFNLSLGQPLMSYPLVTHALQWLALGNPILTNHDIRLLLYSPFLSGSKTEFIQRTSLMQNNDVLKEQTFPLKGFIQTIKPTTPELTTLLNALLPYPENASPSQWIKLFKQRLFDLGFPGEYPLNSANYQCFQRFISLIDELQQWFIINPVMNKTDALKVLNDLAKSTIFQNKTTTAPVQILGLLEASGCCFESVWVTGITDLCLPKKTNLSAFIPLRLQRELHMPHATPERELQMATQLLQRLRNGCDDIVFSHPRFIEDTPNLPSPLIRDFPELPRPHIPSQTDLSGLIPQEESYLHPPLPNEPIRGGTSLLANQAKCPFRAFAAHRLHAKPGPEISDGPDAAMRGQLIHQIMEALWRCFKTQAHLISLTSHELDEHIHQAILQALTPLIQQNSPSFMPLIQDVEMKRLYYLVKECLNWEAGRTPFVVEAIEQEYTLCLAGIDFRVRVDRLDKMSDHETWVIDYKSRLPAFKPWLEDRPEAPQLLLYALLDDTINTLLFVELNRGHVSFSGLSEHPSPTPGVSALKKGESWTLLLQRWRQQLTQLAEEFQTGHCPPQPNRKSTCLSCDFSSLCRIMP